MTCQKAVISIAGDRKKKKNPTTKDSFALCSKQMIYQIPFVNNYIGSVRSRLKNKLLETRKDRKYSHWDRER